MPDNSEPHITSTLIFKALNSQGGYTEMQMEIVHEGENIEPIDIVIRRVENSIYTLGNAETKQITWSQFKKTYLNKNKIITITQPGRDPISGLVSSGLVSGSAGGKRRTRTKKNKRKGKKSRKNKN